MNEYIDTRIAAGETVEKRDLNREAHRIWVEVETDPEGFDIPFTSGDDDRAGFTGFGFEAQKLSPRQRQVAEVDLSETGSGFRDEIIRRAEAHGVDVTQLDDVHQDRLAGAYAVKDDLRFDYFIALARLRLNLSERPEDRKALRLFTNEVNTGKRVLE